MVRFLMTASANPRCRLAPRTSPPECLPSKQNSFKTTSNRGPDRLDRTPLMQPLTTFDHHQRTWQFQKTFSQSPGAIQSP
jgi:hypothetical protein